MIQQRYPWKTLSTVHSYSAKTNIKFKCCCQKKKLNQHKAGHSNSPLLHEENLQIYTCTVDFNIKKLCLSVIQQYPEAHQLYWESKVAPSLSFTVMYHVLINKTVLSTCLPSQRLWCRLKAFDTGEQTQLKGPKRRVLLLISPYLHHQTGGDWAMHKIQSSEGSSLTIYIWNKCKLFYAKPTEKP